MVDATIDVLHRGGLECDQNYMIEGHTLGTHDEPNPDVDYGEIPVWSLVIDHPEGTILWDTGNHHEALEGHWPEELLQAFYPHDAHEHRLDDDLEEAGYSIDDIDYVFQTHLHLDHAGGLEFFDGTDVPIFVHEKEVKFAYYSAKTDEGSGAYILEDFDHDLNWQILHQDREQHFEDLEFVRFPGHTPGLTGTVIHLDDEGTIVFAGDQLYRAENFEDEAPLGAGLLWGKTEWFDSLQRIKSLERRHDAEVVYGHDSDQFESIRDGWGQ
ncbi:N-acyl homoserine lactonase family protein [Natronolimnohabitans innermongolicus]|uniref:Beta-lactamase n=1 Tax=Natronolimnohabitans innermongolicus JCM 12255 TaxID=1227499 RepID=L9XK16_9EURY|nr:N-acyl homoserine lactonase family protein [Natronolimnohabitans innermongolicus]ELY61781.1 beta-lactamase [Natronolimnohabitans innermongolicus JCM 12255]